MLLFTIVLFLYDISFRTKNVFLCLNVLVELFLRFLFENSFGFEGFRIDSFPFGSSSPPRIRHASSVRYVLNDLLRYSFELKFQSYPHDYFFVLFHLFVSKHK